MTVLAVDVGGTNLRAALVDHGTVLHRAHAATEPAGVPHVVENLVTGLLQAHPTPPPVAVGVGLPEYVHEGRATSNEVVDWPADEAARLSRLVADLTGARSPVVVESDVRCGAAAEHALLDRPGSTSLLYVSWGTGLSCAFVLPGGQVWAGARGEALALGEWRDEAGRRLEDLASGRGIEQRHRESSGTPLDAIALHAAAVAGSPGARNLFEQAGRVLGRAVRHLVAVFDPHLVVLGGGLGTADQPGRAALLAELATGQGRAGFPPVVPARSGADAGLLGAAVLARRAVRDPGRPRS